MKSGRPAEHSPGGIIKNQPFGQSAALDHWFTGGDTAKLMENGDRTFAVAITNPEQVVYTDRQTDYPGSLKPLFKTKPQ